MKNKKLLFLFFAALISSSSLIAQAENWKTNGNSLSAVGKLGTTSNKSVQFISNNIVRMTLQNTGNLKISSDQSSIQFPNPGATPKPMMFWYESGSINTGRMIMAYSPAFPDFGLKTDGFNKLDFTDGFSTALSVDLGVHNVGVGTTNPENFKLKIVHGNNLLNGLAIENSTAPGIEWSFFTGAGNSPLNVVRDGAIMGQFQFPSGQYSALSDERLKTNIKAMSPVLEKINRLKPSTYQFKNATDKQDYDGFIAQDVLKIFPSLVSHTVFKENNTDVYTMNYSGFGVIAIKGIQELMQTNDSLKSEIENLKSEMRQIKAMLNIGSQSTGSGAGLKTTISALVTNASLEQNVPNPFPNSTVINYTLPQQFSKANIIVTDRSGKTIKQINLTGSGKGQVNMEASALLPGTYNYSLVVDGKLISTKQMILAK